MSECHQNHETQTTNFCPDCGIANTNSMMFSLLTFLKRRLRTYQGMRHGRKAKEALRTSNWIAMLEEMAGPSDPSDLGEFSIRTARVLEYAKITCLSQLASMTFDDVANLPLSGPTVANEAREHLAKHGLKLLNG